MSDTPRTDAAIKCVDVAFAGYDGLSSSPESYVDPDFARALEMENIKLRLALSVLIRGDVDISPAEGGGWVVVDFRATPPKSSEYGTLEEAFGAALAKI